MLSGRAPLVRESQFEFDFQGTYTVSPGGFGRVVAQGGALEKVVFIIANARHIGGERVAVDIRGIPSGLGPGGNLLSLNLMRQAEGAGED